MGDSLVTTDIGRKWRQLCPFPWGGAGSPSNAVAPDPRLATSVVCTMWDLEPSSRLATIDMGRKVGAVVPLSGKGKLGRHLTQCGLGRGLPQYKVAY